MSARTKVATDGRVDLRRRATTTGKGELKANAGYSIKLGQRRSCVETPFAGTSNDKIPLRWDYIRGSNPAPDFQSSQSQTTFMIRAEP